MEFGFGRDRRGGGFGMGGLRFEHPYFRCGGRGGRGGHDHAGHGHEDHGHGGHSHSGHGHGGHGHGKHGRGHHQGHHRRGAPFQMSFRNVVEMIDAEMVERARARSIEEQPEGGISCPNRGTIEERSASCRRKGKCHRATGVQKSCLKIQKNGIDPVATVVETKGGKFTVSILVGKQDAKPENLNVTVKDRDLVIEIRNEKTSADGTSHLAQVFTKKVPLPERVNVDEVKSSLTPDGVLKIEAPLPVPEAQTETLEGVEIPVTMETEPSAPPAENE